MDTTTCLTAALLLLLAASSATGETETTTASAVTTTVAETTPAPMKESSNDVPEASADKGSENLASPTTTIPVAPIDLPEGTARPALNAEGGSSTDSGNAISNIEENDKINDINHGTGVLKQGQLENEGSTSAETSLSTTLATAVSNEDSSGNTVPAPATRASDLGTGPPAESSAGPVLSTPSADSEGVSASDSPLSSPAIDPSALTGGVAPPEDSIAEAPGSEQALSTEHPSSGADFYSATEQQNSADTTTEYTGGRETGRVLNVDPVIMSNRADYVATSPAAVEADTAISLVPWHYSPLVTSDPYAQDRTEGSATALEGNFDQQQETTPVATTHATPADHVKHEDTASTPPSADETASAHTHAYGSSMERLGENTENQSHATTSEAPLDLAPSVKTTENPQTETDRSAPAVSLGDTSVQEASSEATPTAVTLLTDVIAANDSDAKYQTQPTSTTASQLFEDSFASEGGARETTKTTLSDPGNPLTTPESTPTTMHHSMSTAKIGRSNDLEDADVTTHYSYETTTNPTTATPAATVKSYSTKEEETQKPEQSTSALPNFVSSAETTTSEATTVSPNHSDSPVITTKQNTEATAVSTPDSVSSGSVDFSTPASLDNTQTTTLFEAKETLESATTASATTPTADDTTTVSAGIAAADATTSEKPTEVETSEAPPSSADAQADPVPPQGETTSLPPQGGAEATTYEGTTAPADVSTQEATRLFEAPTTGHNTFSEHSTTQSPDVAVTEETTALYATEESRGTSGLSEMLHRETFESTLPIESTTQKGTPASTTGQTTQEGTPTSTTGQPTDMSTESSSEAAANGFKNIAQTKVGTEEAEEMPTTAVLVTSEPSETSEASTERATTTQPSFETTGTVTYEEQTMTASPGSGSSEGKPTEAQNEVTEQSSVSSVSVSGVSTGFAASSASRSPKQLSESTPATIPDVTTPPYTEQDHKHSFTTAPDLFPTTQAHTTWQQFTDSVSTEEDSTRGSMEQAPWTPPVTTAATDRYWDTTTDRMTDATGSTNWEETVATPIDAACEIVDGSLSVSCLHPEELNHTVTVKFADLNRTRAETFRTEARIWLQEYYRKKGMQLADPAVVFLSGDRGMDLISFFVVNRTRGSVVPSDAIVAVLNNMKVTFEDKLGTVITDVFYGLPVVQKKGVGVAGFLGSQLGLVYVIVGASLAALLLLALLVVIMVKCRTLSANQYSPDSEKLTKDLQMRAEMGDLRPGEEILKEEAQLKEALNGNGTHINGDGWVVPYSQIVSEHKSPTDAQDTRL